MLKCGLFVLLLITSVTAASQTYYIVRHAEKATVDGNPNMSASNPPLSDAGKARAEALRDSLKDKNITTIYSTDFIRTKSTAEPLRETLNVPALLYRNIAKDSFRVLAFPRPGGSDDVEKKENAPPAVLIVGHSNTVDDIVNTLCGEKKVPGDLGDNEYDNLFIVTIRKGVATFERKKYGKPSN